MIKVRPIEPTDAATWLEMRRAFWPESVEDEHQREIERFFAGNRPPGLREVLLAEDAHDRALGFVELELRPWAQGCRSTPVGYLEGWYVVPDARGTGVGRALINASEEWARAQGCTEFASDAMLDNEVSAAAHRALGFDEAGTICCFRKDLPRA